MAQSRPSTTQQARTPSHGQLDPQTGRPVRTRPARRRRPPAFTTTAQTTEQLTTHFRHNPSAGVQAVLEALEELGIVTEQDDLYTLSGGS